jgi:hypothetical protein
MKTPNKEIDQLDPQIPTQRRGNNLNSFLAGAATTLALLALGVGGYLLYRGTDLIAVSNLFNRQTREVASPNATPASPPAATNLPAAPNPYVQPALGNKAQVELISVKRIPGTPNEVSVEMRLNRVADNIVTTDTINIGATTARNPVTNEAYKSVDPQKRSSGQAYLFAMPQGQPADGYVVLKVPPGVTLIDILVPDTGLFKNVLVADAEPVLPNLPTLPAPTPGTGATPGTPATPSVNPLGKAPAIQETIPIPGTSTPVFPTPKTTTVAPESSVPQPLASPTTKPDKKGAAPEAKKESNADASKYIQKAYGNKAQVQLLAVDRIENSRTGKRDLVNVQLRIHRLADEIDATNAINVRETIARNPVSDNTYAPVPSPSTAGAIQLYSIPKGQSVDVDVSLRVPEGVQVLDIYVPQTGTFQQVQISRPSTTN